MLKKTEHNNIIRYW